MVYGVCVMVGVVNGVCVGIAQRVIWKVCEKEWTKKERFNFSL